MKTLDREPTVAELAEDTGFDPHRVEATQSTPRTWCRSRHRRARTATASSATCSPTPTPRRRSIAAAGRARRHALRARALPARRRVNERCSRLRFGLDRSDEPRTLDEIGDGYKLTRERIRQIEAKALTKLRHPCTARITESTIGWG